MLLYLSFWAFVVVQFVSSCNFVQFQKFSLNEKVRAGLEQRVLFFGRGVPPLGLFVGHGRGSLNGTYWAQFER